MVRIETGLRSIGHLVSLLAVVLLFPHLDLPVKVLISAALGIGIFSDVRRRYVVRSKFATVLSLAAFFLYAAQVDRTDPVAPLVNMLILLLGVRLVSRKEPRHFLQIFVLALFGLAGSSLLSLSAAYLIFLIVQVVLVSLGLVLLCFFASDREIVLARPDWRRTLSVSSVLPLGALLLMLVFFAILPRTRYPLWNMLNPQAKSVTGVGNTVSPGSVAHLAETRTVAFRAESEELPAEDLYWRVVVLNQPTGTEWRRVDPPVEERNTVQGGRTVRQTIYPEPKSDGRLMILDLPKRVSGAGKVVRNGELMFVRRPLQRRIKYQTVSTPDGRLTVQKGGRHDFYLRLPENVSSRIREDARKIRDRSGTPEEIVRGLRQFFLQQKLTFSTSGVPTGEQPLESFLYETKRGYCEYFASSFALMLRLAGIPARLVGGYHGGTYNELAGYYLVTENAAHVWVEALVDGSRWQRIDPSLFSSNAAGGIGGTRSSLVGSWDRWLDTVDYYWTQIVITYDLDRQLSIFRQVKGGIEGVEWEIAFDWNRWFPPAGVAVALVGLFWFFRRRRPSPEERLLRTFLRLARRRLDLKRIPPGMGLEELALRMGDQKALEFATTFGGAVYRDRPLSPEQGRRLRLLLRLLERGENEGDAQMI